jgi:hypothetical protein
MDERTPPVEVEKSDKNGIDARPTGRSEMGRSVSDLARRNYESERRTLLVAQHPFW